MNAKVTGQSFFQNMCNGWTMLKQQPKQPTVSPFSFYRHYKGDLYKVLNDNVTRESDGARMVHYRKEKDEVLHRTFVRPFEEFFGMTDEGQRRFAPILSMAQVK